MIFANGTLLPDSERSQLLDALEDRINTTRLGPAPEAETVISAVDALGRRLQSGEFDGLLSQYLPAGVSLDDLLPLLCRDVLELKLKTELGEASFATRDRGRITARLLPLGTLLHIAPGNMPGLPVYSVLEGLLTGNVNLLKLPRADKGLSLAALSLLCEQAPRLAPYIYAFDIPSSDTEALTRLAALADCIVTWGGEGAVKSVRALAPAGCKLIEWGHRLGFAYLSGYEDKSAELAALAEHIVATNQRLCSSCQVIFLDSDDRAAGEAFCREFLPYLEAAAAKRPGQFSGAAAALSGHTALLERQAAGKDAGELHLRGKGCSVTLRPDRDLELSPMEGNVFVKLLPREALLSILRRGKGVLQTAGLICAPEAREELTDLLARAGVTRITRTGSLSAAFPGEGHDGEYPLRRYVRVVDVEG